ncbi:MAG: MIP family channel protein [Bacilli bacterium]|nr:MIP family channel protein [Bacilli bacterium]
MVKKYIAEFVGSLVLVLFACGVAVVTGVSYLGTALAFGLVIVAMAYSIGNVSGCHINPAVSLGMAVAQKMTWSECFKYIISQVLGAICGAALLGFFLGSFEVLGANAYGGELINGTIVNVWMALGIEVILTFVFVLTILGVTDKKENSSIAGLVIGLTLTLVHLVGLPFTGTSVNPARSLGPALFQGGEALSQVWVFLVAPLVGGALAALFYKKVLK